MYKYVLFLFINISAMYAQSAIVVTFENDTPYAPAREFVAFVGRWHTDVDGKNVVYAVDGRKWEQGLMAKGIVEKAKKLYGERYAEFLDNLEAYKYFPLSIFKGLQTFESGTISVKFKAISGRIDRAAGIAFDIKPNGDYLVVRANPLENNLVLFRMKHGKRSVVQWIRGVKTPSRVWHTLKVVIRGRRIEGYLNGKKYIHYVNKTPISGKIGLWSKADSYVFFDDFRVVPIKKSPSKSTGK